MKVNFTFNLTLLNYSTFIVVSVNKLTDFKFQIFKSCFRVFLLQLFDFRQLSPKKLQALVVVSPRFCVWSFSSFV